MKRLNEGLWPDRWAKKIVVTTAELGRARQEFRYREAPDSHRREQLANLLGQDGIGQFTVCELPYPANPASSNLALWLSSLISWT